jgi:hypothetical protein
MVPRPDLLIWVTAPVAQSVQVIQGRGHSRVRGASAARTFVEHANTAFQMLSSVDGLRENIYRIDNSTQSSDRDASALHARALAICEFIKQELERRRPARPRLTLLKYMPSLNQEAQ